MVAARYFFYLPGVVMTASEGGDSALQSYEIDKRLGGQEVCLPAEIMAAAT